MSEQPMHAEEPIVFTDVVQGVTAFTTKAACDPAAWQPIPGSMPPGQVITLLVDEVIEFTDLAINKAPMPASDVAEDNRRRS